MHHTRRSGMLKLRQHLLEVLGAAASLEEEYHHGVSAASGLEQVLAALIRLDNQVRLAFRLGGALLDHARLHTGSEK